MDAGFLMHAFKAGAADLEVGDANGIFIGHPQGEMAGGFAEERERGTVHGADRVQAIQVFGGISHVLIIGKTFDSGEKNGVRGGGEIAGDALGQGFE